MPQDSDTTRCSAQSQDTPAPSVEWKPRSTAPDDEVEIVGYQPETGDASADEMLSHYGITTGNWLNSGGWGACTHWTPLPAPPQPERVSPGDTPNTDPSPKTTPAPSVARKDSVLLTVSEDERGFCVRWCPELLSALCDVGDDGRRADKIFEMIEDLRQDVLDLEEAENIATAQAQELERDASNTDPSPKTTPAAPQREES